jgi:hypothetical protein
MKNKHKLKLNNKTCYTSYTECEEEDTDPPIPEKFYKKIKSKGCESLREYALKEFGLIL